jgi:hypothetical protein
LDGIWAKKNWSKIDGKLLPGGYVRFSDAHLLPDGEELDIRITGLKEFVNNPHKPEIELSNNPVPPGSWLYSMERQIASNEVATTTISRNLVQMFKRHYYMAAQLTSNQ